MHSHFLLQEIFPAQGSNPGLPYFRQILYHLSPPGKPMLIKQCTIYEHSLSFLCYLEMSQVKLWSSKCSPCSPGHARMSKTRNGHLALWWEYKLIYPLWGTVWRFLKKTTHNTHKNYWNGLHCRPFCIEHCCPVFCSSSASYLILRPFHFHSTKPYPSFKARLSSKFFLTPSPTIQVRK